jgi:sugar-specific transcriptional regulator TrmB
MDHTFLDSVGLSPNEGKIYLFLVEHGESSVAEIAVGAGIHRRNAYDAIERLVDKGLCSPLLSSKENRYNAVDPDKLLEIEGEQRSKLEEVLPTLREQFHSRTAPDEAYVYRGLEGQKNIWREMLRIKKDVYHLGAKGQWFDPRIETNRKAFHAEAKRLGITFHFLLDHEVAAQMPELARKYPADLKHRFLPKDFSTKSALNVFGDYVVSYTDIGIGRMPDNATFFIIRSEGLANSYRTWFDYMWRQSKE